MQKKYFLNFENDQWSYYFIAVHIIKEQQNTAKIEKKLVLRRGEFIGCFLYLLFMVFWSDLETRWWLSKKAAPPLSQRWLANSSCLLTILIRTDDKGSTITSKLWTSSKISVLISLLHVWCLQFCFDKRLHSAGDGSEQATYDRMTHSHLYLYLYLGASLPQKTKAG